MNTQEKYSATSVCPSLLTAFFFSTALTATGQYWFIVFLLPSGSSMRTGILICLLLSLGPGTVSGTWLVFNWVNTLVNKLLELLLRTLEDLMGKFTVAFDT